MKKLKFATSLYWFVYYMFFIFIVFSCNKINNNKVLKPITIDVESNLKNFQIQELSEIGSDIEYISLETNDSCLINKIKYLDISDKYILIFDWQKCCLFSRNGKFITQISRNGRGPHDYSHPGQIRIVENEILIPNARKDVIHIYDIKGNFIEDVPSPGEFSGQFSVNNYMPISDSLFLVQIPNRTGKENTRISLINRKGETLKRYKNTTFFNREQPRYDSRDFYAHFYEYDNNVRYKELLNDTIWQIEQDEMKPIYVFDRGKYGTPTYSRGLPSKESNAVINNAIHIINLFEINGYVILKTNFMKHYPFSFFNHDLARPSPHSILGIYNKSEKKFFFVEPTNINDQIYPTGFNNDIDGGVNFMPEYKVGDSSLVSWLNAYELNSYVSSETFKNSTPKYPEKKKELEKLVNSIDENDNPVLMLVKLKN